MLLVVGKLIGASTQILSVFHVLYVTSIRPIQLVIGSAGHTGQAHLCNLKKVNTPPFSASKPNPNKKNKKGKFNMDDRETRQKPKPKPC